KSSLYPTKLPYPVIKALPVTSGIIALKFPTVVSSRTLPTNLVPIILSYVKDSLILSNPLLYNAANLALVPVPQGDLSTCPAPNITTFFKSASPGEGLSYISTKSTLFIDGFVG